MVSQNTNEERMGEGEPSHFRCSDHSDDLLAKLSDAERDVMEGLPIISDAATLLQYGVVKVPVPNLARKLSSSDNDNGDNDNDNADSTSINHAWAKEFSQVTPLNMALEGDGEYAFYRNILDEPDFPFDCILQDTDAIVQHFPIDSQTELRLDDAFCVYYNAATHDTTSGDRHMDPSDVTVNMCLHKTPDAVGSYVLFYGARSLAGRDATQIDKFLVVQEEGYATIHFGDHFHQTISLLRGERTNIVLTYCYKDETRSDVATRTCY
uniref:Fe2OG dioxygenase domain-containing protein n=1 Tax=Craspedostauros australis TaxID=1486917 RepID=A0A7R9WZN3_9STRA